MDILKSLLHPSELLAFFRFFQETRKSKEYTHQDVQALDHTDTRQMCYYYLVQTSRSFAAVVQALDPELRDPICIFYLVLRGLDTVEDDMSIELEKKVPVLRAFHEKLYEPEWKFMENGEQEKDRFLLRDFDLVIAEFLKLKDGYQKVIADICKRMGNGMADFANAKKVGSKKDWDLYCHYVAGLVGVGLCQMFAISGLEDPKIAEVEDLANSMGLFLQKVNIIRDYLEDFEDGRTFWPEEVWSKYATNLGDLREPLNVNQAVNCLNDLICDALGHIPDCLKFMKLLKDKTVFRFCAIPQVMAIATLSLCFNNKNVFKTNVKIRKGLALKLIMEANTYASIENVFAGFCKDMSKRIKSSDPNAVDLSLRLSQVDAIINN